MENTNYNFYQNRHALVTGGAGFIGSHIVHALVDNGAYVTVLDNLSTGTLENLKSIAHRITFINGDISNHDICNAASSNQDIIFHLGAFVSAQKSRLQPKLCYKINVDGTTNMLQAAVNNRVTTFVFSSSASVYGFKNGPCSENDPINPQTPYAQSKATCEKLCIDFSSSLQTTCLRYFNVYGPRQNPHGDYAAVVATFSNKLRNKQPLIIYGDGFQKRDFIQVDEVVRANLFVGTLSNFSGNIFNIGTGKSINLFSLIDMLEHENACVRTAIYFKPFRKGDLHESTAQCQKFKKLTLSN